MEHAQPVVLYPPLRLLGGVHRSSVMLELVAGAPVGAEVSTYRKQIVEDHTVA